MPIQIGKVRFDDWVSLALPGGFSDTFIFRMSPTAGLPPADYARLIRSLVPAVLKLRSSASLWVQVDRVASPKTGKTFREGRWFAQEVRRALRGVGAPVAVTAGSRRPQMGDFSFFPWAGTQPALPPPAAEPYLKEGQWSASRLNCLRVLARADCAYTAEVASFINLSRTSTRKALYALAESGYIQPIGTGKRSFWQIRPSGLSIALRSWGLPPGFAFPGRKERGRSACQERQTPKKPRSSAGRHRRTARLWPAWLQRAWPRAQIWAGWSEVPCGRARPDALCWGQLKGSETLFWLEVESGNSSRTILREKMIRRINRALIYARGFSVNVVFALLGQPWVLKAGVKVFFRSTGGCCRCLGGLEGIWGTACA